MLTTAALLLFLAELFALNVTGEELESSKILEQHEAEEVYPFFTQVST